MSQPFQGLAQKIKAQYKAARESNAVIFFDSEVVELDDEFEVRLVPGLAKKPQGEGHSADSDRKKEDAAPSDPFAPPYIEELFVAEETVKEDENDAGETFVVLLNKFCVVPRHALLVTKEFVRQGTPLSPLELFATWSIVKQLGAREKHVGFFNCGPESGASQPHKHLQFMPLSGGVAPFDEIVGAHKPQNRKSCFQLPLPYANFTALIEAPSSASDIPAYLGQRFLELLDLMIDHRRRLVEEDASVTPAGAEGGRVRLSDLSYSLIITPSYLHLVPRRREKYTTERGHELSINALGYAGMMLVKDQESLEDVQKVGVLAILTELGFRPVGQGETKEAEAIVHQAASGAADELPDGTSQPSE
ncbi:ATP adenylyltransferase [Rhodotorula sp. JG-1b]|nr:ATP adenylyltransferase [Rhodotorula sp. JG-1b]